MLILRREAAEAVGGFDERFFMYSEEADLCRRVRDAGWEVRHLPVMRILHYGGKPNPRLAAQASFSRMEYAAKHFGRLEALVYRAVLALHHSVRIAGMALRPGTRERSDARAARAEGRAGARRAAVRQAGRRMSGPRRRA